MPDRAEDWVPCCCAVLGSSYPVGQELNQPLGMRDPTASHSLVQRELPKSRAKACSPLEAQRSRSREPGAPHGHQSQQGKIQHPSTTETAWVGTLRPGSHLPDEWK